MYLLFALAHGVPVFIAAAISESKVAIVCTAVVMVAVGVATGNPAYLFLDVLAVGVTSWICWSNISPSIKIPNQSPSKVSLFFGGMLKDLLSGFVGIAVILAVLMGGIIYYNRFLGNCADGKLQQMNLTFEQCNALHRKPKK